MTRVTYALAAFLALTWGLFLWWRCRTSRRRFDALLERLDAVIVAFATKPPGAA